MRHSKFHPALAPSLVNLWIPQSSVNVKVREKIRLNQFYLQVHICFDSLCFWLASNMLATCFFLTASSVIGCFGFSPCSQSYSLSAYWLWLPVQLLVGAEYILHSWWHLLYIPVRMLICQCLICDDIDPVSEVFDSFWVPSPSALSNLSWWRHQGAIHLLRVYPNMTYRHRNDWTLVTIEYLAC